MCKPSSHRCAPRYMGMGLIVLFVSVLVCGLFLGVYLRMRNARRKRYAGFLSAPPPS